MNARTPLVNVFQYQSSYSEPPQRPWKLGPWAWATQGHFLVAVQDDAIETDPTPEPKRKAWRYLHDVPADVRTVSLPALRAFAGPVDQPAACDDCHGTAYQVFGDEITCEHCGLMTRLPCAECDGDGLAGVSIRHARIAGVPLNLALLSYALTCVPEDVECQIGSIEGFAKSSGDGHALLVIGRTWRIAVMCVRGEAVAAAVPAFPSVVPADAQTTDVDDARSPTPDGGAGRDREKESSS